MHPASLRPPAPPLSALLLATVLQSACTVGPDYHPPVMATPSAWHAVPGVDTRASDDGWWRTLGDARLDALMEAALAANPDLDAARARIAEARAARAGAAAADWPSLAARAGVTRQRQSENGLLPIGRLPGIERDVTLYDGGFDASWEIDLFGGTRRRVEAADARTTQANAAADGVRLAVAAEVARSYLALRAGQHRLAALQAQHAALVRIAQLVARQVAAGQAPPQDGKRAEAAVAVAAAELPAARADIRGAALAIGVLLGQRPEQVLSLADEPAGAYVALAPVAAGTPADLLRRRPDVRAAERALAAATADVGAATAAWFPRLSLGMRAGQQALDAGDFLSASSQAWSIAPLLTWQLLDGGRIRAQVNASEARTLTAAANYEKAVVGALGDAEQALLRYDAALAALAAQRDALAAAARTDEIAQARHRVGDIALPERLEAAQQRAAAEAVVAARYAAATAQWVALMKALGGDWQPITPAATAAPGTAGTKGDSAVQARAPT